MLWPFAARSGYVQRKKCIVGKQLSEIRPGQKHVCKSVIRIHKLAVLLLLFHYTPGIIYNPLQRAETSQLQKYQYLWSTWEINLGQDVGYIMNKSGEIIYV